MPLLRALGHKMWVGVASSERSMSAALVSLPLGAFRLGRHPVGLADVPAKPDLAIEIICEII
jgi:hypothetical protein